MAKEKALSAPDVIALTKRMSVGNPDPEDIRAFRAALADYPRLWTLAGDLAQVARLKMLESLEPPIVRESVEDGMRRIARDLAGDDAPLIERLLAEHAALCWAGYYLTEFDYHRVMENSPTPAQADYWERRVSAAQRRYLRAIESLARTRRLLRPKALQVNIGAQQVNVQQVESDANTGA